ncbi:MAG: hypothetical protein CLLPBCKN_001078 [Chroococcidiopsis cubana SAG 39.79]|nr:hypothetical protein [Chroococcidiopsis cubana SAG 39.79]
MPTLLLSLALACPSSNIRGSQRRAVKIDPKIPIFLIIDVITKESTGLQKIIHCFAVLLLLT